MRYEGAIYRPPSEAYSLIIQVTLGCSHNKCTFCISFREKTFRIRPLEDIKKDLVDARAYYRHVEKIFLADGDALIVPTSKLLEMLHTIKELFPECNRVGVYGSSKAINRKSEDELTQLKEAGLGIVYMGLESGNEEILRYINKGVAAEEMVKAGQKLKSLSIPLSITIISGLGGSEKMKEHAIDTAKVLNRIDPDYLGLLTLILVEGSVMFNQHKAGEFTLLSPPEVMLETKLLLENLKLTNCVFRANHASNYVPLAGTLPQDKERLLGLIDQVLESPNAVFKHERLRGL